MNARYLLKISLFQLLVSSFAMSAVMADEWLWIEEDDSEFRSESGKYLFKVMPHEGLTFKPGYCQGVLYALDNEQFREIWQRYLINNEAPVKVFVADSGKYVVTMDEWGRVGKLPVVIYGKNGKLIKVHNLKSLGIENDEHIRSSISSYWWNEDAISFFGPDDEYFFIRLHWGKLLIIELRDGYICDDKWYETSKGWYIKEEKWKEIRSYANKKIREIAISMLGSKDPLKRKTGVLVSGQLKIRRAIFRLRELLNDTEFNTVYDTNKPPVKEYYIRKRAKKALEEMDVKVEDAVIEEPAEPSTNNEK